MTDLKLKIQNSANAHPKTKIYTVEYMKNNNILKKIIIKIKQDIKRNKTKIK